MLNNHVILFDNAEELKTHPLCVQLIKLCMSTQSVITYLKLR